MRNVSVDGKRDGVFHQWIVKPIGGGNARIDGIVEFDGVCETFEMKRIEFLDDHHVENAGYSI